MNKREQIHWYSGVLLLALGCFAVVGMLWGLLRPKYQATIVDAEGALELNNAINVEFAGFMWFVIATGVTALWYTDRVLAPGSLLLKRLRLVPPAPLGVLPLVWLGLCTWLGSVLFVQVGEFTTMVVFDIPTQESNFSPGDIISYVPRLDAGRTGHAVAPFASVLYYWTAVLIEPRESAQTKTRLTGY